jgi:hypothetical protein
MKKVFINITGVLRDTYAKAASEYRKYYIETDLEEGEEESFEYDMVLPVDTNDLSNHFKFQSEDELKYFFFIEFAIEIFGHSAPVYSGVFRDLSDLMKDNEDWEITIVSDEVGKGKPSSLFFLSKNTCYVDNYKFYKKDNIETLWEECDIWITSDYDVITKKPEGKTVVKIEAEYNKDLESDYSVEKLTNVKELEL